MKKNIGSTDKLIRFLAGVTIMVLFYIGKLSGAPAFILLAVAGVLLLTRLFNVCPLYSLLGINTCPHNHK